MRIKIFSARITREVLLLSRSFEILTLKEWQKLQLLLLKLFIFLSFTGQGNSPIIKPTEITQCKNQTKALEKIILATKYVIKSCMKFFFFIIYSSKIFALSEKQSPPQLPCYVCTEKVRSVSNILVYTYWKYGHIYKSHEIFISATE